MDEELLSRQQPQSLEAEQAVLAVCLVPLPMPKLLKHWKSRLASSWTSARSF